MAGLPSDTEPKPPSAPRWVRVLAIIAAVVIAVVIVKALLGGEGHGPGRHMQNGAGSGKAPVAQARH